MKRILVFISALLIFTGIFAKWDMIWADGNEFHITATNYGVIGHDVETGGIGGYWPSGYPDENYIYGSGIWFGGLMKPGGTIDTLVSLGYNPGGGTSEFCPGDGSDAPEYDNELERVYNSGDDWPPMKADSTVWFDSTFSEYDTYTFFSDKDSAQHFSTESVPLGITVKQWTYQWTTGLLSDVVFLRHVVKNENANSLDIHDCYYSFAVDADIGNESGSSANDLLGFIDTMRVSYNGSTDTLMQLNTAYQFQLEPESGWTNEPRILSLVMLETPITEVPVDLYHDGQFFIAPYDEMGMTSLQPRTLADDPSVKEERYQLLAGYDFQIFDPADPEQSYKPFPLQSDWGNPQPGYPGISEDSSRAGDKRFNISSGPFDLDYGDSTIVTIAFVINQSPDDIVPNTLDLMEFWETGVLGTDRTENNYIRSSELTVSRLVSDNKLSLLLSGRNTFYDIALHDLQGRKMLNIFDGIVSGEREIIREIDLPSGIYFVKDARSGFCERLTLIK